MTDLTEFETQVARALIASPTFAPGTAVDYYVDLAYQIAPRVAAAIAAAGKVAIRTPEDGDRARAAGLAALRGTPP